MYMCLSVFEPLDLKWFDSLDRTSKCRLHKLWTLERLNTEYTFCNMHWNPLESGSSALWKEITKIKSLYRLLGEMVAWVPHWADYSKIRTREHKVRPGLAGDARRYWERLSCACSKRWVGVTALWQLNCQICCRCAINTPPDTFIILWNRPTGEVLTF